VAFRRLVRERLLDDQRLVGELGLGGDQRDLGAVGGEVKYCQQGLQAGDAAAEDQCAVLANRLRIGAASPARLPRSRRCFSTALAFGPARSAG
jgi:hypothetical protein